MNIIVRAMKILSCFILLSMLNVTGSLFSQNGTFDVLANDRVQQQEVTGHITDSEIGDPLPGVSVVVEGTSTGTTTDMNGNYSITVPGEDAVLVFSYVGYEGETRIVGNNSVIDLELLPSVHDLDELVVIGYGMETKALMTGATTNIRTEDLERFRSSNPLQAMQGQTPGMQVLTNSGQPGSGLEVVVRGLGTIGNSDPLYIVDGVQVGNINHINVADIESVDILKDAASAAIYGSQAANGVVLVTTKTGSVGAPTVTYDSYYGVNTVANNVETLNAQQYMMIMNEQATNGGQSPHFTEAEMNAAGEGTDWVNEMYYDGLPVTQSHTLSISGGTESSTYSMSLGYAGEEGIIGGPEVSNYDRYSFRLNTDHEISDYFAVGQRLNFNYRQQRGIADGGQYSNRFKEAFQTTPLLPMYDDDGNYFSNTPGTMHNGEPWEVWWADEANPYASMMYQEQDRSNDQNLLGSVFAEVTPFENFSFRSSFGLDYSAGEYRGYSPIYSLSTDNYNDRTSASQSLNKGYSWTIDNIANYSINLDDTHNFALMAGMSAQKTGIGASVNASNSDLILPGYEYAWVNNATNSDQAYHSFGASPWTENSLLSYFGRVGYNYQEKYMINATYRVDGSSRFSEENRWGYFPSVSAGWVMSSEPFMDDVEWLDFLKPRASWGQVGNQRVSPHQYLSPISVDGANNNVYFGSELSAVDGVTVGSRASRLPNPDLKWETSEQLNFGIDAYMMDSRFGVIIDWYKKTTRDWIVTPPVLATVGTGSPAINGGTVENQGLELGLSWQDQVNNDLGYNVSVNLATNKNEVVNVPTPDGIIHGQVQGLYDNADPFYRQAETGFPIGYFWGYETDGLFQNETDVQEHVNSEGNVIQPNASPGDLRYVDQNDDGTIGEDDKGQIGNPWPEYTFGLSAGLDYKGVNFSITASGVAGNDIIQNYRQLARARPNYPISILDRWHGEGTSNSIPRVTDNNAHQAPSDYFVHKGDYLRISNLTIGYDLSRVINQPYLSRMNVYGSVNNVYTFTSYNGSDPEVGHGMDDSSAGADLGFYPRPRTIMIGLNLEF
ncbi:MAG: TonB-dependent receptor [Balneolales bacterium]